MPIVIKDYCWKQTIKHVIISIPLKNGNRNDVDFLTYKLYIKASYPPYFFELFLAKPIDSSRSTCFIRNDEIIFELSKSEPEVWDELEARVNKEDKIELKKKFLEDIQKESQEREQSNVNKKAELKREAVREQIRIDTVRRNTIDDIKKEDTRNALIDLKLWKNNDSSVDSCKYVIKQPTIEEAPEIKKQIIKKCITAVIPTSETSKFVSIPDKIIPLPRKCQTVNVSFTDRIFPTPSRESKAEEEQEWLAKQAAARRFVGFDDADLRPEERNPQWLKDKGDEFFRDQNYLGAISAYTTGIKLSKNLVGLYINRSAAQFAMGNLHKTVDDSSTALELMIPICEANRILRVKCLARRGAALIKLGLERQGNDEIDAALKLVPHEKKIREVIEILRKELKENLGLD